MIIKTFSKILILISATLLCSCQADLFITGIPQEFLSDIHTENISLQSIDGNTIFDIWIPRLCSDI